MKTYFYKISIQCLALILLCLVSACTNDVKTQNSSTDKLTVLKFKDMLKAKKILKLSEVAEDIEYVKLEMNQEAAVCGNPQILLTNNYIFVNCQDVLQFGRDGKFIRKIGLRGKGPKEYVTALNITVDEKMKLIYIHSIDKVVVYSLQGTFVKSIHFPLFVDKAIALNDDLFLVWKNVTQGNEDYIFALFDSTTKIISSVKNYFKWPPRATNSRVGYGSFNEFYSFKSNIFFKDMYNDTVYTIIGQRKIVPSYFLSLGKYKLPDNHRPSYVNNMNQAKILLKGYLWANVQESNKYIFINSQSYLGSENKKYLIIYDKETHSSGVVSNLDDKYAGFTNDLDGGPDFWPKRIYNDQWMYTIIQPEDFIKITSNKIRDNCQMKFPEKQIKLKIFLNHLNVEDNPIVMIIKLK